MLTSTEFLFLGDESILESVAVTIQLLKITGLYTLNEWSVNYISIKKRLTKECTTLQSKHKYSNNNPRSPRKAFSLAEGNLSYCQSYIERKRLNGIKRT